MNIDNWVHNSLLLDSVLSQMNLFHILKNGIFWDVRCVAIVRTDLSEELNASFIAVTRIGVLGTLAATSNRCCVGC
jgi:hypothetical protein